jgi:hypothetical protein
MRIRYRGYVVTEPLLRNGSERYGIIPTALWVLIPEQNFSVLF